MKKTKDEAITESPFDASQKPMFNSEDLIIPDASKMRYDESVELKKDINELRQKIHQQGLDKGIPREILNVINDVAHSVSGINSVWDNEKNTEKEQEEDSKIEILLNQGNEIAAYSREKIQKLKLREQRVELRGILYKLVFELQRLQRLVQSNDSFDYRRK